MASRVFLVLFVGIVAAAALAFAVADVQRRDAERGDREQRITDRVSDFAALLERAPDSLRPVLLNSGSETPRSVEPTTLAGVVDVELTDRLAARLGFAAHVVASEPPADACDTRRPHHGSNNASDPMRLIRPPLPSVRPPKHGERAPPHACRLIAFSLPSGERVVVTVPMRPEPPRESRDSLSLAFLVVVGLAAAALAYMVAGVATAPLRRLSRAAGDLGRDLGRPPLIVEGPLEVRQAAEAFNAMQVRLKRDLEERTHMLAAITHDLQTPMTRQRLRLEKVADPDLRRQLIADQAAMQEMIRDGLDLARASGSDEDFQELDVDSLLQSLCEDAVEAGFDVSVRSKCDCSARTRPQALMRCVSNLLDNALKYAGSAELSAIHEGAQVLIHVRDRGPGIAPDQLDAVLQPFVRLETSRSRETGGVGLGLTIARILAERSGGALRLSNRPDGGLDASVSVKVF